MPVQVREEWNLLHTDADLAAIEQKCLELEQAGKFDGSFTLDDNGGYPTRTFADQESADVYIAVLKALNNPPESIKVTTV